LPSNPKNDVTKSGSEPYMMSNMYLGPENTLRKGETTWSWVTGTGGWLFRSIVEFLIGVRAEYDGLLIDPCLPKRWENVKISREFRGDVYDIEIINKNSGNKMKITVDGEMLNGNIIPPFGDGKTHFVTVEI